MYNDKKLLFLINFFDWLGLWLAYPWLIFWDKKIDNNFISKQWDQYNNEDWWIQIYLHTLFCETKCLYCNCISYVETKDDIFNKYKLDIISQIEYYSNYIKKDIDTIYFWWGTFSMWSKGQMEDIILTIKSKFNLKKDYKWMVEIHPNSITREKLELLKKLWITDLMIWLQTTSERLNKLNNRIYNKKKFLDLVDNIIDLNFDKVYFDLMYWLPYETDEEVVNDMEFLLTLWEKLKKVNFVSNLELHRFNISNSVSYFKKLRSENINFSLFIKNFLEEHSKMDDIVYKYKKDYLEKLFPSRRDEIVARKKHNTAILWIWTWSISYIPNRIYYYNNINNLKNWVNEKKYEWYILNNIDTIYSLFFNDIRYWIEVDKFKSLLKSNIKLINILKNYKNKFKEDKGRIFLNINSDYDLHMIILSIYSHKEKEELYKKLIHKWNKLEYSEKELEENIDLYLKLYY